MPHSSPTALIRGGQTTQHWWRMAMQVLKTALFVGVATYLVSFSVLVARTYELPKVGITYVYWLASYNVERRGTEDRILRYRNLSGDFVSETAGTIYSNRSYRQLSEEYQAMARRFAWLSLIPALLTAVLSFGVFYYAGRNISEDEHVRGTRLVSRDELKVWSKRKWKAYRKRFGKEFKSAPVYTIAGIPFPPNAVEAQTGIFGTVGVGKTNAIRELLTTIRRENGRAIIYDRMGGLVRDFYDPERDIIINPFDARSVGWSPFGEAFNPEAFAQIAEVMIPDRKGTSDPFWTQTARIVFEFAARKIMENGNPTNEKLRKAILEIPAEKLAKLIDSTPGRHFFNESIEKTAASIRANLVAELKGPDTNLSTLEPLNLTRAEAADALSYKTGDIVVPLQPLKTHGLEKGQEYVVEGIDRDKNALLLSGPNAGNTHTVPLSPTGKAARVLVAYERSDKSFASHDQIRFRVTDKDLGISNGERGQITEITEGHIGVIKSDGRAVELPRTSAAASGLDHAYALTAHGFQGATVDRIIVALKSSEQLATQKSFYVAISRARDAVELHTDDAGALMKRLEQTTGARPDALEAYVNSRLRDREQDDGKPDTPTPKERDDTDQKQKTEETKDKRDIEDGNHPSFSGDHFKNLVHDLAQGRERGERTR